MGDLGVHLQILLGATVPLPAPSLVVEALQEIEVQHNEGERDGFQITFSLGRSTPFEYDLLASGLLDPPARVILFALVGVVPDVLIDGIITDHQVSPSNRPGESRLVVSGVDVSVMMDLEEKNATYPYQSDSVIVTRLIASYAQYGLVPMVVPTADVPLARTPNQQETDYQYIQRLARRNGYVFYVESMPVPGVNTAYWGPAPRAGIPQPALTLNMAGETNVDAPVNVRMDALRPANPEIRIVEAFTGMSLSIPVPSVSGMPLALHSVPALRKTISRDTARLEPGQAAARAFAEASSGADAVTLTGEVDGVRYGHVLKSRRLVGVRGVGISQGGLYYVKHVTHRLKVGEYKQSFSLSREGRGATMPALVP